MNSSSQKSSLRRALAALALAGALALPSAGCRNAHLGPDTGEAYRDAVANQREGKGEPVADMTADDARAVLRAHGAAGEKSGAGTSRSRSSSSSSSSSTPMDVGGRWGGATGSIRLDAK